MEKRTKKTDGRHVRGRDPVSKPASNHSGQGVRTRSSSGKGSSRRPNGSASRPAKDTDRRTASASSVKSGHGTPERDKRLGGEKQKTAARSASRSRRNAGGKAGQRSSLSSSGKSPDKKASGFSDFLLDFFPRRGSQNGAKLSTKASKALQRKLYLIMRRKLTVLFGCVAAFFVFLAFTVTMINAQNGTEYKKRILSQAQARYDSRVTSAKRGDIYDRRGNLLAVSNRVYSVILDCNTVNSEDKEGNKNYFEPTINAMVDILGLDEQEIRERLTNEKTRDSQYQIIKKLVPMEIKKTWDDYLNFEDNKEPSKEEIQKRNNIKGVWFEEDYLRVYPFNTTACDVIGFTYSRDVADWGLEGYYNTALTGVDGRQYGYFNSNSEVEQSLIAPENGYTLETSLDIGIQQIVEKYVDLFMESTGAKNVGVIVENPKTGEILAMDGGSRYDLNDPRATIDSSAPEKEQLEALYSLWNNFCVTDAFEPGSVVKPLVMSSALEYGKISPSDHFDCDGYEVFGAGGNTMIRCAVYPDSHGRETLADVIANSCNDGMMQVAAKMGVPSFIKSQNVYNFGSRTGIDLPNEGYGMIHNVNTMGDTELACSSFGQGFTVTMIQEINAICSCINGGYYYQPHIVTAMKDSNGRTVRQFLPTLVKQTVSENVSANIRSYMEQSVLRGTSYHSRVLGYSTGGKTGTAEKLPRGNKKYLVSFIGFAPVSDPAVVIYVVVDEPNVKDQATSSYPQYIAQGILTELLPYMNIRQDQAESGNVGDTELWEGFTKQIRLQEKFTTNEEGKLVDSQGNYVDWEGNLVDEEGYLLNEDGSHKVDDDGYYILSDKLDADQAVLNEDGSLPEAISDTTIPEPLEDNSSDEWNKLESEGITNDEAGLE